MKTLSPQEALTRAAALCSRSEHAPGDIHAKLLTWGLSPTQASQVTQQLIEENFLNENRYAHAFVHDKIAYNGWGRVKVAYHLKMKGISAQAIENAMEQIDANEYHQLLLRLLQAKWKEVATRQPPLARAALLRFGASRGFEQSLLFNAVNLIMNEDGND